MTKRTSLDWSNEDKSEAHSHTELWAPAGPPSCGHTAGARRTFRQVHVLTGSLTATSLPLPEAERWVRDEETGCESGNQARWVPVQSWAQKPGDKCLSLQVHQGYHLSWRNCFPSIPSTLRPVPSKQSKHLEHPSGAHPLIADLSLLSHLRVKLEGHSFGCQVHWLLHSWLSKDG